MSKSRSSSGLLGHMKLFFTMTESRPYAVVCSELIAKYCIRNPSECGFHSIHDPVYQYSNRKMGPLRFELRYRRDSHRTQSLTVCPERRRMVQATLRSLTGMVRIYPPAPHGTRASDDNSTGSNPDHQAPLQVLHPPQCAS